MYVTAAQMLELPATLLKPAQTARLAYRPAARTGRSFARRIGVLAAVIALLATFGITLTHLAPYQNVELDSLFADEGWAGIQPQVTTLDEAVTILQAHPWVREVQVRDGKVSWWWNGQQPALYDDSGRAFDGRLETALQNGRIVVTSLVMATRAALGDVRLTLGEPDVTTLYFMNGSDMRAGVAHVAEYRERDLVVFNLLGCPAGVADFWNARTFVAFGQPNLGFEGEKVMRKGVPLNQMYAESRSTICP